jgi:hypothetical protein
MNAAGELHGGMQLLAVTAWVLVGLGLIVDIGNAWMLLGNFSGRRFRSAVWLVPVVFYFLGAAGLSAVRSEVPSAYGRTLVALAALHACVLLAHVVVGDRRPRS